MYEWLTATSYVSLMSVLITSVPSQGQKFHGGKGAVLLCAGFALVLAWIFFSFPLVVFSFLKPRYIQFVSPLSSALDSEILLNKLEAKAQQGDIC